MRLESINDNFQMPHSCQPFQFNHRLIIEHDLQSIRSAYTHTGANIIEMTG